MGCGCAGSTPRQGSTVNGGSTKQPPSVSVQDAGLYWNGPKTPKAPAPANQPKA